MRRGEGAMDCGAPERASGLQLFAGIDMRDVRMHYMSRRRVARCLIDLLDASSYQKYVRLALGIDDVTGNYSAAEHELGPQILAETSVDSICKLARSLRAADDGHQVLRVVYQANIPRLRISVGTEMAMLLRPRRFWVANVRSVWAHLVVKHHFNVLRADEALALYRLHDLRSEMKYSLWRELYPQMRNDLLNLGRLGAEEAGRQRSTPGKLRFLWADAVANALYDKHHGARKLRV